MSSPGQDEYWDKLDADPEDIAAVRAGLADGLIEWEDVLTSGLGLEPPATERVMFRLAAESANRLRTIFDPSQIETYD